MHAPTDAAIGAKQDASEVTVSFDVFLGHDSYDKPIVRQLADAVQGHV